MVALDRYIPYTDIVLLGQKQAKYWGNATKNRKMTPLLPYTIDGK